MPYVSRAAVGIVTVECDPSWSPCQKEQARAKVAKMNAMCPLTRRPGISADDDGLACSLRDLGNAGAKTFKSMLRAQLDGKTSRAQMLPRSKMPKGDSSDLMSPCMEDELAKNPKAINGWSADHVQDMQFGGSWSGPLKMLDSEVNESLGRQMSRGPGVVTQFQHQGCM